MSYGAASAVSNVGYFCSDPRIYMNCRKFGEGLDWWMQFLEGPVAISALYFEEGPAEAGAVFTFWGCRTVDSFACVPGTQVRKIKSRSIKHKEVTVEHRATDANSWAGTKKAHG